MGSYNTFTIENSLTPFKTIINKLLFNCKYIYKKYCNKLSYGILVQL